MVNDNHQAVIKFAKTLDASLNYWITASGITASMGQNDTVLNLRVLNSRGTITPGFIAIPLESLDELIADLHQLKLYAENKKNHAQQEIQGQVA